MQEEAPEQMNSSSKEKQFLDDNQISKLTEEDLRREFREVNEAMSKSSDYNLNIERGMYLRSLALELKKRNPNIKIKNLQGEEMRTSKDGSYVYFKQPQSPTETPGDKTENFSTEEAPEQMSKSEKKTQTNLNLLVDELERELANINSQKDAKRADPLYVKKIASNIEGFIDNIASENISPKIAGAFNRVSYVLEKKETLPKENIFIELEKALFELGEELRMDQETSDGIENKTRQMIKEVIETAEKKFNKYYLKKNNRADALAVAHEIFINISKIKNSYLSDRLKGVLMEASFLKEKSNNLGLEDIKNKISEIILALKKEIV